MLGLRGTSFSQSAGSQRPLTPMALPNTNGHQNGASTTVTNGHTASNTAHTATTASYNETRTSRTEKHTFESSRSFSSEQQITVLRQTVTTTRAKLICDLADVNDEYIDSMTMEYFLEYIESERLTNMPQRGSRWDKVLKWAEFFALQISGYETALGSFVPQSESAAQLIWASCRVLIELGPANSQAIETAFAVLYKVGLSISFFLQHRELLSSNPHIRTQAAGAFDDLLLLVRDITIYYYIQVNTISGDEVSLDFGSIFGRAIETFYSRKERIIEAMWASRIDDESINIHAIRIWLSIHDATTRTYLSDRAAAKARRGEYTCDWFQRPLLDFTRGSDDVLAITGASGSGKSMLSGWIVERLQRPIGKKTYETLSLDIDIELPEQCTTLAVAKNLALQLLRSNIGDVALLSALSDVYNKSLGWTDHAALETGLWTAIHMGLRNSSADNLVIIVDGLDDRCGHEMALSLCNRITELTSKHNKVQAIILTRNATHFTKKVQVLAITPDRTHFDLQHITSHALQGCQHYLNQNDHEREAVVEKLTHAAKGSFLWTQLMAKFLKQETSHDGFIKAVKNAHESPKSTEELIRSLVSIVTVDFTTTESTLLLSWLLASQRPLTTREVRGLLQVDIQKKTILTRHSDVEDDIRTLGGSLIRIQNGIVRFRHVAIREQLLKISAEGKKLRNFSGLQSDLTGRLLAYCKFRLTSPSAVSFDHPEVENNRFLHDALLEYASRNWIYHFKKSTYYKSTGAIDLHADFKALFPSTVQLALIEWSCWGSQSSGYEAATLHDLALRIRQETFTEKHESVIQTLIICGHLQRKLFRTQEAGNCFYRASRIGQSVLKPYSAITLSCTTTFLEITDSIATKTRTEIVTRREDLLQYAISVFAQQHGKTSDIVIKYHKLLAELYVLIHEEEKAEKCWKELREIIVTRYGEGSSEEESVCGHLKVVLKKGESQEEIIEYERNIFDTTYEMEIWDMRRIEVTLKMAIMYESHSHLFKAEECYIMIWSGLIEYCHQINKHLHVDVEVHICMIDIALEYVRFLRRHHRHEEAASILICVWAEYEEYEFESETIFLRLKVIGELMRSVSLLSIAISVFKKCWSWFKSHEKHEHTSSCQILISETIEEIITNETTSTTTETVIRQVFESSISKSTVTAETISICQSFISLYMKNEQWTEAITASTRSLELIWKLIVTGRGTVALPREFASEAIEIATRLAICHHRSNHFHEAEEVYLRIYRACFSSCNVHDERFTRAYTCLVKFYEEHKHWDKVVHIYRDILVVSRKHLGVSHTLTIKFLYKLGSLCSEHGYGNAHEYYEEIITVLNGSSNACHHDSFQAMEIMCRVYYEQGNWKKLKLNCEILWESWTHHHKQHKFDAKFIELLYVRYIYVLEHHFHVDYEIIRRLTIEFRETCVLVFGAASVITVKALIELAQISMRSEKYTHDAIRCYEEVIKITTTTTKTTTETVSTTTLTSVKESLVKAYIHVCSKGSVSTTITERAISILTERFDYLTITFGCSHTETLTVLRELVQLYWKLKTKESIIAVARILLETTILVISKETHSRTLFESAKTIGAIYVSCGLIEEGRNLLHEMHRQIVLKTQSDKCGFKIGHSVGRTSFVFLVTFGEILQGSISITYSKIMADLLTETILFESYTRCVKSEKNVEVTLMAAAKFFVFLEKSTRKEQVFIIQEEVHKIFMKKWGSIIKTKQEISLIFVASLLRVLGTETRKIRIGDAACRSSNNIVRELLLAGEINKAYEVAFCAFQFGENQGTYHHLQNVGYGFKLSAFMASRGLKHSDKPIDSASHSKMLDLSRKIITVVLKACKDSKINFARMKLGELNDLVGLLGEQKNYADLEWILNSLWSSREVQKQWSPPTIVSLAQLLIQARFLLGQHASAIKLSEAICYNLRRVYGSLDPKALDMSDLLSQIYIAAGHYNEAMRLHEEILRLVVDGDDSDDRTLDTVSVERAVEEIAMLKQCYLRLKGWDKKAEVYKELVDQLFAMPVYRNEPAFKALKSFDSWNLKEKPEGNKEFRPAVEWRLVDVQSGSDNGSVATGKNSRLALRRITSNWGMDIQLLNQGDDGLRHGSMSPGRLDVKPEIVMRAKEIEIVQ